MPQQEIGSYYDSAALDTKQLKVATGDYECDVCVIGGGFTGISTALYLAEAGYKVILLEANKIAWGASGRNGGLLHTGLTVCQSELEAQLGRARAHELWQLSQEAKHLVKARILKHKIKCDYNSGILYTASKPKDARLFESQVIQLRKDYHYKQLRYVPKQEVQQMVATEIYHGGMLDMGAGHIQPLNYALGLAQEAIQAGVELFEGSAVTTISQANPVEIKTQNATIKANYSVLACNGYLGKLNLQIANNIMVVDNFIIATEPLNSTVAKELIRDHLAINDTNNPANYYRLTEDNRLLFGGGKNYTTAAPNEIKKLVRPLMLKVFPQLKSIKIDYAWSGTLAITDNKLPDFGQVSSNLFYAQGFSGQGVTLSCLAGKLIAEAISGNTTRFNIMAELPKKTFPWLGLRSNALAADMFYQKLKTKFSSD